MHRLYPCHAEQIKMPHPLLISTQSDYLIQFFDRNSHILWQTVQIQIIWNWSGSTLFAKTGHDVFSKRRVNIVDASKDVSADAIANK